MRLHDRLLSRQGYWEAMYSGAYVVSSADPSGRDKEGAAAAIVRTAREAYASNGIVAACAIARMALFSEARFQWKSDIDRHLFGTRDLRLVEYPWPNATQGELLSRLDLGDTTAGNAYIRKAVPADGTDALLVEMRPDCVSILSEEARDNKGRMYKRPVGYLEDLKPLGITNRPPQFYEVSEVAHYNPVPDPSASFRGMSWLTPILREVGADQAMVQYKTEHLRSGAQLGLVIKYAQKLAPATVDTLRERVTARYAGPQNAGKTLVLDQGADVVVAGSTLEQLQFVAVQTAGENRIASAAQVPVEVIGLEGPRSASGNYELAIRRMADLWARPHWRMACASLQHLLTFTNPQTGAVGPVQPPFRLWYDVSDIAALREGELARGQTTLVKAQAVASFVTAGYTRESAVAAADSGDLTQLKADPQALPPGSPTGVRAPQAAKPEDLPGVVKPNVPNAKALEFAPMPPAPNGSARGGTSRAAGGWDDAYPFELARDWNPALHPRDRRGKFAHVPGRGLVDKLTGEAAHLNDEEYAAHASLIEDRLREALQRGESTDARFAIDASKGIWQPERARQQRQIVNDMYKRLSRGVPADGEAVIAGGLGGAGKSTVLRGPAHIDQSRYFTLNPDDIKEEMVRRGLVPHVEGLSPMEASALIHEESSHIANLLAKMAYADRKNVIWDITMSSRGSVERRIEELRAAGYRDIRGVFVDIPLEKSVERALARHRRGMLTPNGGRYVPPSIIRKNSSSRASSANREVFDELRRLFDAWELYDNSGAGPRLVEKSRRKAPARG